MIDLSIGNPNILSKTYTLENAILQNPTEPIYNEEYMPYNKQGIITQLDRVIRDLHRNEHSGNLVPTSDTQIVVGAGATQLLMGLFQYAKEKVGALTVPNPYWFRTPRMTAMRGCTILPKDKTHPLIPSLITLPNNPDGSLIEPAPADFLDCVYHWSHYYPNKADFNLYSEAIREVPRVAIFSLGKFSGHAGTRIGWAQVNDPSIAAYLKDYVEYDSGGVSVEAQLRATHIIQSYLHNRFNFDNFQRELTIRKYTLKPLLDSMNIEYKVSPGLFAWVTSKNCDNLFDYFKDRGIKVMQGTSCGGSAAEARLNLCENDDVWEAFLSALGTSRLDQETIKKVVETMWEQF